MDLQPASDHGWTMETYEILPPAGHRVIPVTPQNAVFLDGRGELFVTPEPSEGTPALRPDGAPVFPGRLRGMIN